MNSLVPLLHINLSKNPAKMPKRLRYLSNKQLSTVLILVCAGIGLGGCAVHPQPKPFVPEQLTKPKSTNMEKMNRVESIPVPEKLPCHRLYQDEITALKQMLTERDEVIRNLSVRELDRTQALQETASEINRAKNKLHRLATQPEAASRIAEVEVAIAAFKQAELGESDTVFRFLAQSLLNAAMAAYEQKDYSNVMNYTAQSSELINVIANRARKNLELQDGVSSFRVPILLLVTQASNLRIGPDSSSKIISLLKKNTPLTAIAYYGNWLHIQTAANLSGWIENQAIGIQINDPGFRK